MRSLGPGAGRDPMWPYPWQLAYNPAPIANWNIRPSLLCRTPFTTMGSVYAVSLGGWFLEMKVASSTAGTKLDGPVVSPSDNTKYAKFPLGFSSKFVKSDVSGSKALPVTLLALPSNIFGVISLGALQHAQLSPFGWDPTYVVGNSLASLSSPYSMSASPFWTDTYVPDAADPSPYTFSSPRVSKTRWEREILRACPRPPEVGDSRSLLQQGDSPQVAQVTIDGVNYSTKDQVLAYDIAFETNYNLWDSYFLSTIPVEETTTALKWRPLTNKEPLSNTRYEYNQSTTESGVGIEAAVNDAVKGSAFAFWNSAAFLRNKSAFNVNSTSLSAWRAFLSGLRNVQRPTGLPGSSTTTSGNALVTLSRVFRPESSTTDGASDATKFFTEKENLWKAGRELSDDSIEKLATEIVKEVKARGPFLSLSDFVNRRLIYKAPSPGDIDGPAAPHAALRGALEHALQQAKLNVMAIGTGQEWYASQNLSTSTSNPHTDGGEWFDSAGCNSEYSWKIDVRKQPNFKTWGAPGYITQGDLLEVLGPAMTVRGDTFTIRTYGESKYGANRVAKVYLEAVVSRSPEFCDATSITANNRGTANRASDPVTRLNRGTGQLTAGVLNATNSLFGRKYQILSTRWLSADEI